MPPLRTAAPIVCTITLVAATALADTVVQDTTKVAVEVPSGWKTERNGPQLIVEDQKEDVVVILQATPAGSVNDSADHIAAGLRQTVEKIAVKEQKPITVNGMKGTSVTGDGTSSGTHIEWTVLILDTPSITSDLFVMAVAEDVKFAAHRAEVRSVFDHIRPAP